MDQSTLDMDNNNDHSHGDHQLQCRMSPRSQSSSSKMSSVSVTTVSAMQRRGFADVSNVRIPIIGYEVMEERARFTVYKLRIENPFTNDCWLVLRRYTDFVRLNNKLKTIIPNITLNLPRKNIFGNNFGNEFLENRLQGLQTFVNTIMANDIFRTSQVVKDFFCLDEPPTYSESLEECRAIFEAQDETICHLKLQLENKDEQIAMLQQKLNEMVQEKLVLDAALKTKDINCTKCSQSLDNNYITNNHNNDDNHHDIISNNNKSDFSQA